MTARASDANLLRVVEGAVRLGTPLLLDEMPEGSLPPGLEGLLQPQPAAKQRSGTGWSFNIFTNTRRVTLLPVS